MGRIGEYIDTISGAESSRPERNQLIKDATASRIEVVIVWKLDCWGRSLADSVVTLERLASAGVRFICVTQGLDTDNANPVGRATLSMLQVFAQFERDLINERVNSAIKRYQNEFKAGRTVSKSGKIFRSGGRRRSSELMKRGDYGEKALAGGRLRKSLVSRRLRFEQGAQKTAIR